VERAKSYLLSQFKDKPNINALVDALVSELQELENVINQLQTVRTLEGAYGWWLDQIGSDLDISRGSYGDDDYKTAIKIAMARQSASATVDDILRIVSLITNDEDATLSNDYHYLMELYSYFFCVSESIDGLYSLANLFPLNTRVRFVKHDSYPFILGSSGVGFGIGQLCDLILTKNGVVDDPRFVTTPTQDIPPAISSVPSIKTNPYISGNNVLGSILTLVVGEYDGDDPLTYNIQWLRNGINIAGQTSSSYLVVNDDLGKNINVSVTVTNPYGEVLAYSNTIVISSDIPAINPIKELLGLSDHVTSGITSSTITITNTSSIKFKNDGSIDFLKNAAVVRTNQYLNTVATSAGSGYRLIYTAVEGQQLTGLNQNAPYTLSADLTLSLSVTARYERVNAGTYRFTISKIDDPTISRTHTIYISTEIINENPA
jgi:hypothetical protein